MQIKNEAGIYINVEIELVSFCTVVNNLFLFAISHSENLLAIIFELGFEMELKTCGEIFTNRLRKVWKLINLTYCKLFYLNEITNNWYRKLGLIMK